MRLYVYFLPRRCATAVVIDFARREACWHPIASGQTNSRSVSTNVLVKLRLKETAVMLEAVRPQAVSEGDPKMGIPYHKLPAHHTWG